MRRRIVITLVVCAFSLLAGGVDVTTAQAAKHMESGQFDSARVLLRKGVKQFPTAPELWNLLGICESELKHGTAAREAFERASTLAPDSPTINENLGLFYFRDNNYQRAREYLAKAVAGGSNAAVAFSLAASEVRTGDAETGLVRLRGLESQLRDRSDYWTERGWVEMRFQPQAAESSFARALELAPDDIRALNGAASAAETRNDDEKALSLLLHARKVAPDDIRTLLHFGTICLRRDLTVDARDALERARKLAPSNNLALFLYARTQIAFQQWQLSHDLFTELDRRLPKYAPAQYVLGWLDLKLNRPDEARKHLETSLMLAPDNVEARYELGQLDLNEGRIEAAQSQLEAVIRAQPRHPKALVALGDIAMHRGNLAEAKARYEAGIEADPSSGSAHYKLSTVLMRLQDTERAQKERALGAALNVEAVKASKTVLVLSDPEGRLLTGEPGAGKGGQ